MYTVFAYQNVYFLVSGVMEDSHFNSSYFWSPVQGQVSTLIYTFKLSTFEFYAWPVLALIYYKLNVFSCFILYFTKFRFSKIIYIYIYIYIYIHIHTHTHTHTWSELLVPLVNMIKEGCEN